MTSKRMIYDNFFRSEDVAEWTIRQRLFVIGIIANADDQGRIRANVRWLRSRIFPYDDITADELREDLEAIAASNDTLLLYNAEGKQYIQLKNWWDYQTLQWAKPSEYPAPEGWKDRVRMMIYKPKRWVMTQNWPGTADCLEYRPKSLGNKSPNVSGNKQGDVLDDALPLINTTTTINIKEDVVDDGEKTENGNFRQLLDAFCEASGIAETLFSPQQAVDTINKEWLPAGVTPEEVRAVVHELNQKGGYQIVAPRSISKAIGVYRSRQKQASESYDNDDVTILTDAHGNELRI